MFFSILKCVEGCLRTRNVTTIVACALAAVGTLRKSFHDDDGLFPMSLDGPKSRLAWCELWPTSREDFQPGHTRKFPRLLLPLLCPSPINRDCDGPICGDHRPPLPCGHGLLYMPSVCSGLLAMRYVYSSTVALMMCTLLHVVCDTLIFVRSTFMQLRAVNDAPASIGKCIPISSTVSSAAHRILLFTCGIFSFP